MDELNDFLLSDEADGVMTLDILDGYLSALAVGPAPVPADEWLPGVWGDESQRGAPLFATRAQAQRIVGLILRHYDGIFWRLQQDADAFDPMFGVSIWDGENTDGEMWAHGFMQGLALRRSKWQPLFDDEAGRAWLRPLYLLGAEKVEPDEAELTRQPAQRGALSAQIPSSVAAIYRYWLARGQASGKQTTATTGRVAQKKIGRNDPCPCGSGKKFKKCCGAETGLR